MLEAEFPGTLPRIAPGDQSDKITVTASRSRSALPRVIPKAAAASSTPQLCRHACQPNGWAGLGHFPDGAHPTSERASERSGRLSWLDSGCTEGVTTQALADGSYACNEDGKGDWGAPKCHRAGVLDNPLFQDRLTFTSPNPALAK